MSCAFHSAFFYYFTFFYIKNQFLTVHRYLFIIIIISNFAINIFFIFSANKIQKRNCNFVYLFLLNKSTIVQCKYYK